MGKVRAIQWSAMMLIVAGFVGVLGIASCGDEDCLNAGEGCLCQGDDCLDCCEGSCTQSAGSDFHTCK
jgi:hypothetical protein